MDIVTNASCACLKVVYRPIQNDDGTKTERWVCEDCGSEFKRTHLSSGFRATFVWFPDLTSWWKPRL